MSRQTVTIVQTFRAERRITVEVDAEDRESAIEDFQMATPTFLPLTIRGGKPNGNCKARTTNEPLYCHPSERRENGRRGRHRF
ncbi:hypothetical protein HOE425_200006 [Hoeflea sp. EC-HK425]|nr:hypothetical protein HOE425_200006 [Hoeflea sp. EC-HK425]